MNTCVNNSAMNLVRVCTVSGHWAPFRSQFEKSGVSEEHDETFLKHVTLIDTASPSSSCGKYFSATGTGGLFALIRRTSKRVRKEEEDWHIRSTWICRAGETPMTSVCCFCRLVRKCRNNRWVKRSLLGVPRRGVLE